MRRLVPLALALAVAAPAFAGDKPPASQPEKQRLVCTSERLTGSHLKKRVCVTEEQREQRRNRDQQALREARRPGMAAIPKEGQ